MSSAWSRIQKYAKNTAWLLAEKVITMVVGFFATVVVARTLGPESYGILAYSVSLAGLFSVAGHMGLQGLVVREIVENEDMEREILGTTLILKGIGYLVGTVVLSVVATVTLIKSDNPIEAAVIAIAAASLLVRLFDVLEFWFSAKTKSRYVAIAHVNGQLGSAAMKLLGAWQGAGLVFFAFANLARGFIFAGSLMHFFRKVSQHRFRDLSFRMQRARSLLSEGMLAYLAAILSAIYLKIDQTMLRWLSGPEDVGYYAVAATFSEVWSFIPIAFMTSVFPALIALKKSPRPEDQARALIRLQQLFDLLLWIGIVLAAVVTLLAPAIIKLFFGEQYEASINLLIVHIWGTVFLFSRAVLARWLIIERRYWVFVAISGMGAVINIALNIWLIPIYGAMGAAVATVFAYAFASYFALILYVSMWPILFIISKSLIYPLRLALGKVKND